MALDGVMYIAQGRDTIAEKFCEYPNFDFMVDEGEERPNPSRDKK